VIAFLEGNSKIGLRQAVVQVPYYDCQVPTISFELRAKTAEEIDLEKCTFRNFRSSVTLTLTLDRVEITLVRICDWGLPTYEIRWNRKNFLWTYVQTNGRTHL